MGYDTALLGKSGPHMKECSAFTLMNIFTLTFNELMGEKSHITNLRFKRP
jgi:hypothetical protein